ncbi:hypothetical protein GGF50DRAFT_131754 [Schizophyllum commune]
MSSSSSREPVPAELIDELKYVVTDIGLCLAFFGVQIAFFIGAAVEGRVWVLALSIVAVLFCSSVQAAGSLTDWWFQILGKGGANDVNGALAIIEGLVDTSFHISVSKALNAPMIIATLLTNAIATVLVGIRVCQVGRILVLLLESGLFYCAIWGILSTFTVLAITAQEHLKTAKSIGGPRSVLASIQFMDSRNDDDHSEGSEEGAVGDFELIPQDEDQGNYTSIGIQIALFVGAAVVLARKENRAWIFALSIVAVFFCSSAQAVGSLTDWWFQFLGEGGSSDVDHTLGVIEGLIDTSFHISYLVGDALVVWRAWVLWPRSWVARCLLATCMVFTVGKCTLFGSGILLNTPPVGLSVDLYIDFSAVELSKALNAPMIIAVLLTNALATILVGIRVWEYRRNIASALGQNTFGLQVGRILVLLLESGLFYCVIWVCIFALDVGVGNVELGASIITGRTLHQVATAYPTFVILILTSQQCTTNSTVSHQISLLPPMQFDSGRTGGITDTQETIRPGPPNMGRAQETTRPQLTC